MIMKILKRCHSPIGYIEAALQRVSAIENCSSFMEHEIIRPREVHPNTATVTYEEYLIAERQSHETHLLYSAARIYADYINSVTTLDAKLCDPSYRKDRILAILSHHAIAERNRAGEGLRELPHRALMEKYFSVHDYIERNTHLAANFSFDSSLDALQNALDELTIFVSFAFPRQFVRDPSLRAFLDTLWSKRRILDYITQGRTPKDFIAIAIHKALEPGRELDCFKAHILGRVRGATLSRELSLEAEEYTHPLIQEILKELSVFKHTSELALSTVVQPVNSGVVSLGSFSASD